MSAVTVTLSRTEQTARTNRISLKVRYRMLPPKWYDTDIFRKGDSKVTGSTTSTRFRDIPNVQELKDDSKACTKAFAFVEGTLDACYWRTTVVASKEKS